MSNSVGGSSLINVLGPVRVRSPGGEFVDPASASQRQLIGLLTLHAGAVVAIDTICESLDIARGAARTVVSRVRRLLGPGVVDTVSPGYVLHADSDLAEFETLVRHLRTSGGAAAIELRDRALALAREGLLPEFADRPWAQGPCARIDELRTAMVDDQGDDLLAAGRPAMAIALLRDHLAAHPYRERSCGLLMRSLAVDGRQAEALRVFTTFRRRLADDTGLEPSADLHELNRLIATDRVPPVAADTAMHTEPESQEGLQQLDSLVSQRRVAETGEGTPSNLPTHASRFIGREAELGALQSLVVHERLVTVVGSGGAGKTRLAQRAADECVERFPDGVWWLELASVTEGSEVAQQLADVLGARVTGDTSSLEAVARRLSEDRALVVFDNAEHLVGAVSEVATALLAACPRVNVLITSRRPLAVPGERHWRLPSMSLPRAEDAPDAWIDRSDAVALFVDRAHAASVALDRDELPVVGEVCERLDGVPLAIELAAARTRTLTPAQISAGLDDALRLLTRGHTRGPARHQTVEASIAWSIGMLDAAERELLDALVVFNGSFDLDAVAAVCERGEHDSRYVTLDVLESLIDHSLVVPLGGTTTRRFRMLETVRQFSARRRTDHAQWERLQERHARYYVERARTYGAKAETSDEIAAITALDGDVDNIRAVLLFFRDRQASDDLAELVRLLAPYWNMSGS
ncbi:MAG: BTAD domain-containing putative transcriptional regulator, partial [Actinomycetota bacterium]